MYYSHLIVLDSKCADTQPNTVLLYPWRFICIDTVFVCGEPARWPALNLVTSLEYETGVRSVTDVVLCYWTAYPRTGATLASTT